MMLLASCTSCANSRQANTDTKQKDTTLIKFQKTPCYGECPAYEATITQSGKITLTPWKYMPVSDTVLLTMSGKELKQLKKDIHKIKYESLATSYLSDWSDTPSTYVTFFKQGKEVKRIKHQEGGPKNLTDFIGHLDALLIKIVEQHVENSN